MQTTKWTTTFVRLRALLIRGPKNLPGTWHRARIHLTLS